MLTDYTYEPEGWKAPEYAVIFFHGYGSSAWLMRDYVGKLLGPLLPEARLHFPDAPIQMSMNNHSWFDVQDMLSIPDEIGPDKDIVAARARAAAKEVNDYIDNVIREDGIPPERIILAGFSQGATMAWYAGLLRDEPIGGIFSLSGGALEKLDDPKSRPPVALLAGEKEIHGYSGVPQAETTRDLLLAKGFSVTGRILAGQGHQITPASMQELSDFARGAVSGAFAARLAPEGPATERPVMTEREDRQTPAARRPAPNPRP